MNSVRPLHLPPLPGGHQVHLLILEDALTLIEALGFKAQDLISERLSAILLDGLLGLSKTSEVAPKTALAVVSRVADYASGRWSGEGEYATTLNRTFTITADLDRFQVRVEFFDL